MNTIEAVKIIIREKLIDNVGNYRVNVTKFNNRDLSYSITFFDKEQEWTLRLSDWLLIIPKHGTSIRKLLDVKDKYELYTLAEQLFEASGNYTNKLILDFVAQDNEVDDI